MPVKWIREYGGAQTCPRRPRHASVVDALASWSQILFLNANAYTVIALGGHCGENGAESSFTGRIIRLPDINAFRSVPNRRVMVVSLARRTLERYD